MESMTFLETNRPMPLMELPLRSTVISIGDSKIILSPGSTLSSQELKKAGDVTDIVATNALHCGGIPHAAQVFPQAKVWACPGVKSLKPEIAFNSELSVSNWPYQSELKAIPLRGIPQFNETAFVHIKTQTLFVTDLCFNISAPKGFGSWLILKMFGTYKRFAVSRLFVKAISDRAAFQDSIRELFKENFDRIVMSHGDVVPRGGKEMLRLALKERGFTTI